MKNMNKILSLLLVLCMVLTMLPVNAFAAVAQEAAVSGVESESTGSNLKEQMEAIKENAPELAEESSATVIEKSLGVSITEIDGPGICQLNLFIFHSLTHQADIYNPFSYLLITKYPLFAQI